jgi:hypothetical protein
MTVHHHKKISLVSGFASLVGNPAAAEIRQSMDQCQP